jgi:ceramide glucosyltransferase
LREYIQYRSGYATEIELFRRKRYRLRPRSPLASEVASAVPGVTILRPLKGLDTNLYENLESTFIQEYPNYEIIMSVADERDQALSVVRDLLTKYPNANAKVIIGKLMYLGLHKNCADLTETFRRGSCGRESQSEQPHSIISSSCP